MPQKTTQELKDELLRTLYLLNEKLHDSSPKKSQDEAKKNSSSAL